MIKHIWINISSRQLFAGESYIIIGACCERMTITAKPKMCMRFSVNLPTCFMAVLVIHCKYQLVDLI